MGELVAVIVGFFAGNSIASHGSNLASVSPLIFLIPVLAVGLLYTASWWAARRADKK